MNTLYAAADFESYPQAPPGTKIKLYAQQGNEECGALITQADQCASGRPDTATGAMVVKPLTPRSPPGSPEHHTKRAVKSGAPTVHFYKKRQTKYVIDVNCKLGKRYAAIPKKDTKKRSDFMMKNGRQQRKH